MRGVSLLLPQPDATAKITELEREAKISIRRLTTIGERQRVIVTGDVGNTTEPRDEESTDTRRDDSLIADQFAMFASDIASISGASATSKSKSKSKSSKRR